EPQAGGNRLRGAASAALPRVGETVEIIGDDDGAKLRARRIARRPILVGPIASIDLARSQMEVLGQTVAFEAATRANNGGAEDTTVAAAGFAGASQVRISGLRRADGSIVASRIDSAGSGEILLGGTVSRSEPGAIEIGTVRVDVSALV